MDIKSTMQKFGFGHRKSRHIILENDGELWLAAAPQAEGGFGPPGVAGLPGTLRIEPLENGDIVPFSYTATESVVELTTEKVASARFTIDKDAQAIIIKGDSAIRLNAVQAGFFASTRKTPAGVSINLMTVRYMITVKKGKITFDDTYVLSMVNSVIPVVEIQPENGEIEFCVFDLPAEKDYPEETKAFDECAAENSAEFHAFIDTLVDVPAEWSDVKEKIAYPLWLCHRFLTGETEVIVDNKRNSTNTNSRLMSIASMAFKDPARALEIILAYPAELPPVAGVAVTRLLGDNMLNDSRGDIFRAYSLLESIARKCINKRTVDKSGLSFYAYRYENGISEAPEFFKVGEPVLAPDLNAYLVIAYEAAGKLALMEYDDGAGKKWEANSKRLLTMLLSGLWNGEDFIGRNAYTDEASAPDAFLSLVPIILGERLPSEIIKKLTAKISAENVDSATGFLLAGGLYDAGEKQSAQEIAISALGGVRSSGVKCPFYGASLLALAHKVL